MSADTYSAPSRIAGMGTFASRDLSMGEAVALSRDNRHGLNWSCLPNCVSTRAFNDEGKLVLVVRAAGVWAHEELTVPLPPYASASAKPWLSDSLFAQGFRYARCRCGVCRENRRPWLIAMPKGGY